MCVWCVNVYCLIDWGGLSSVCVVCQCILSYRLGRSLQCVHVWRVTVCCLIDWGGLSSVCVVCQCLLSYRLGQSLQCVCGVSLSIVL